MTFDVADTSSQDAAPVELYRFARGIRQWLYTSADENQVHLGQSYAAAPISRGRLADTAELNQADLNVYGPHDLAVADQFRAYPPGEVVTLDLFQRHRTDVDGETRLIWSGRVLNARWEGDAVTLICEPITTSLRRPGVSRRYGPQCPHTHYGLGCGLAAADFRTQGAIAAQTGAVLSVPQAAALDDGYLVGGYVWWQLPSGERDARMVLSHVGDQVGLAAPLHQAKVGDAVELYPGCDRSLAQCDERFGNADNFGGWPFMPGSNPFSVKVF